MEVTVVPVTDVAEEVSLVVIVLPEESVVVTAITIGTRVPPGDAVGLRALTSDWSAATCEDHEVGTAEMNQLGMLMARKAS